MPQPALILPLLLLALSISLSTAQHPALDDSDLDTLLTKGTLCRLTGDRGCERASLEAAYAINPRHPTVVFQLASLYMKLDGGSKDAASLLEAKSLVETAQTALDLTPQQSAEFSALALQVQSKLAAAPSARSAPSKRQIVEESLLAALESLVRELSASGPDHRPPNPSASPFSEEALALLWSTAVLHYPDELSIATEWQRLLLSGDFALSSLRPLRLPHVRGGRSFLLRIPNPVAADHPPSAQSPDPSSDLLARFSSLIALFTNVYLGESRAQPSAFVFASPPRPSFASDFAVPSSDQVPSIASVDATLHVDAMGSSHTSHVMGNSHLTGIFCVSVEEPFAVHLSDPRPGAAPLHLTGWMNTTTPATYYMSTGSLLLFPSFVRHHILAHRYDSSRVFVEFSVNLARDAAAQHDYRAPGSVPRDEFTFDRLWSTPVHVSALDSDSAGGVASILNPHLKAAIHDMRKRVKSVAKSNKGGWQSPAFLFNDDIIHSLENPDHRQALLALRTVVLTATVRHLRMLSLRPSFSRDSEHCAERESASQDTVCPVPSPLLPSHTPHCGHLTLDIKHSWAGINRLYDANSPHVHPESLLSGVYYVDVPRDTCHRSSVEFIDPRAGASMASMPHSRHDPNEHHHITDSLDSAASPTDDALLDFGHVHSVESVSGRLVLFPAWLEHYVAPYLVPDKERVIVSFNVHVRYDQSCGSDGNERLEFFSV